MRHQPWPRAPARRASSPRIQVGAAERARRARAQPRVDARRVVQVPARRQPPHRLAATDVLEAHRARRVAAAADAERALVLRRRQRVDRRGREPALRRGGSRAHAPHSPRRRHDAPADGEERGGHGDERARLPDDDGDGEDAEHRERAAARAGENPIPAAAVVVVVDADDAGARREPRVQVDEQHGHSVWRQRESKAE